MKKIVILIVSLLLLAGLSWAGEKEELQLRQKVIDQELQTLQSDFKFTQADRERLGRMLDILAMIYQSKQQELKMVMDKLIMIEREEKAKLQPQPSPSPQTK